MSRKSPMFFDGRAAMRVALLRQMDRVGDADSAQAFAFQLIKFIAMSKPWTHDDAKFKTEWDGIHAGLEDGAPMALDVRQREYAAVVDCLYRAGMLGQDNVPHDPLDRREEDGSKEDYLDAIFD